MERPLIRWRSAYAFFLLIPIMTHAFDNLIAADKLVGIHSVQSISQSMPRIAQGAGLFKKHSLDFQLIYIGASPLAMAVMLGGEADVGIGGASAYIRAFAQGATDFVFISAVKNILTHVILTRPEIKKVKQPLDPRLNIKTEAIQAILEEVSQVDPKAKKVRAQDLIDRRYLDEMERSGTFDQLWSGKRQ